ncbi:MULTISPECIES: hypothetical protein [Cysteiniphilum]|uniref:Uncharacterized protein n=1 Tax=Cysteiniphilum litorale TaxID=2056700 RepID=A0A8J2Z3B5_9GAMM|nr:MULTISPECIES: hypothetical protein [Cysteiniphilum]GGF92115.1 hypothetical protein GCM10010995_06610 [Cysteiniphilum litorale]
MSTIFHEGRKILRQYLGKPSYVDIADLIYFRVKGSKYYDDDNNQFFILPNIEHIADHTGHGITVCKKALSILEHENWISKKRKRCFDGAVRLFIYTTAKFNNIMDSIENIFSKNSKAQFKESSTLLSNDDSTQKAKSDSTQNNETYIKEQKKIENNSHNNLSVKLNNIKMNVMTVIFDFSKYDLGDFICEAAINNELTEKQKEVIHIIIINNTSTIDLDVFREAIANKTNKAYASDFKHLVSIAYREAKSIKKIQIEAEMITSDLSVNECYSIDYLASECDYDYLEDQSNSETLVVGANEYEADTNMENNNDSKLSNVVIPDVDEVRAIIQAKLNLVAQDDAIEVIETVTLDDGAINDTNHSVTVAETENSGELLEFQEENRVILERIGNVVEAMQAAGYVDAERVVKTAQEILVDEPEIGFRDLFDAVHYLLVKVPLKAANSGKSKLLSALLEDGENPDVKPTQCVNRQVEVPTLADIEMPKVSDTRLRHDLASEAEQVFFKGKLPYSQTAALVGIIDYVKRQGVVIGSDKEVYQWLYHMASNKDYYYSNAMNFKHWCNIVMTQLKSKSLHKPFGHDKWISLLKQNGCIKIA